MHHITTKQENLMRKKPTWKKRDNKGLVYCLFACGILLGTGFLIWGLALL